MSEHARIHLSRSARGAYSALQGFAKSVGALAAESGIDARMLELVQLHASQLNGCAYCVRVHVERGQNAGLTADEIAQVAVWRDSGVFTERERAALELAEAHVFIHDDGVPDDVYERVLGVLSEEEYVAVSWLLVSINAFNRVAIAGRYPVPPRGGEPA
jgi:AhpD family alkylhydroperoxidase